MQTTEPAKSTPLRIGPQESLVSFGLAAGVFGLWMIQFENLRFTGLAGMVFFFVITIWLRRNWAVYLMFATMLFLKFVDIAPQARPALTSFDLWDLLFTGVAMVFAGLCFRYLELAKYIRAFYPSLRASSATGEKKQFQFPSLAGGRWWLMPIAIAVAALLLLVFPHDADSVRRYWITPAGARMIFIGFFLFFVWFVCLTVVSSLMRWKMDRQQASVRVRSIIAKEYWGEQAAIEVKRAKLRRRLGRP